MMSESESNGPDQDYRSLAEQWEPNPARPKIAHPLPARLFLEEVEFLRALMTERKVSAWQRPFDDLLALIREVGILRNGDWDPYWFDLESPHIEDSLAMELVDNLTDPDRVPRGRDSGHMTPPMSRRMAIATAVVEFSLPGNGFDAACKRLQRMLKDRDNQALDKKRENMS